MNSHRIPLVALAFALLWVCLVALTVVALGSDRGTAVVIAAGTLTAALLFLISRQQTRLRGLAWTDPLTGLANHRGFHEQLRLDLSRAQRDGSSVTLVSLDLDNFKAVNDRYGHPHGDQVLKAVGKGLTATIRDGDVAARTGGEEFALILPGIDAERAVAIAERARAAVAEIPVDGIQLSCSAGLADYPADAEDPATLCQLADGALYWAKRTGKHRTRRFDPQYVRAGDETGRRAELAATIESGAIVSVFQPVVALATGRVTGYEALARFTGSPRTPQSWFSEAHAIGLGPKLEAAAIRAALEPLGRPPGTHLALNVGPSALFSDEVRDALPENLTDLVIEITEHEDVAGQPELIKELEGLRARGAQIAVDDAGAGYSGLKALAHVRPDIVKLDRGLIDGIHGDPARMALVESFVRFAGRIDATVCAEGIESPEDLAAIADLDVPWGQGFALARPARPWPKVDRLAAEICRTALAEALQATPRGSRARIAAGDRLLENLSGRLASARSSQDLENTLALIAAVLNADKICLSRWHPERGIIETLAENGEEQIDERYILNDYPLTAKVLLQREAAQVLAGDPTAEPAETELLLNLGHRSLLMVPVVHRGESLGIIEAFSNVERPWTRTEINRARIISNQFASTIQAFFLEDARSSDPPA